MSGSHVDRVPLLVADTISLPRILGVQTNQILGLDRVAAWFRAERWGGTGTLDRGPEDRLRSDLLRVPFLQGPHPATCSDVPRD